MRGNESLRALGDDIIRSIPRDMRQPCKGIRTRDAWTVYMPQFTQRFVGLYRQGGKLSPDESCIGASTFEYCWVNFYDKEGNRKPGEVRTNTVIIDDSLYQPERLGGEVNGRGRFTEMHECCHHLMVKAGFQKAEPVKYRIVNEETKEEKETDYLAAYLLMPDSVLTAMMMELNRDTFISYEGFIPEAQRKIIHRMALALKVSDTALNKRLDDAGFFDYRSIYEFYDPDNPNFDPVRRICDDKQRT